MLSRKLDEYEDRGIFKRCIKAIEKGGDLIKIKPGLSKVEQKYIDNKKRKEGKK